MYGIITLYLKGKKMSEEMSHEEAKSLEKLIHGAIDAFEAFQKTGNRAGFRAHLDQTKAHEKEFNSRIKIEPPKPII